MRRLIILWVLIVPIVAFAASPKPMDKPWGPVAADVCQQLKQSVSDYNQNNLQKAHLTAVMAYFKHYDVNLEPAVRTQFGNQHVFAIENLFSQFPNTMVKDPTPKQRQQVEKLANNLCSQVTKEAMALNKNKVPRQVYQTGS